LNRTSKETGKLRHLPVFLFSEDCLAVVFREHLLDIRFTRKSLYIFDLFDV